MPRRKKRGCTHRRRILWALRHECPPLLPVRVRMTDVVDHDGVLAWSDVSLNGKSFLITIRERIICPETGNERAITWYEWKSAIMEERAHLVGWSMDHEALDDHGPEWGLAMSRVKQAVDGD